MSRKFLEKVTEGSGYTTRKFESAFGMKIMAKMGWKKYSTFHYIILIFIRGEGLGKKK